MMLRKAALVLRDSKPRELRQESAMTGNRTKVALFDSRKGQKPGVRQRIPFMKQYSL